MPHHYPSRIRAWYLVILLTIAYVFSFVDKYLPALLLEPIKADLGVSDTQMGLLLGPAFAVLYATLGLPLGWLADRVRRNSLVAAGVALWSLATASSGLAANFTHLLLARVGVGVGDAALAPGALSLISDSFPPDRRGRPVALYITAQSFGAGLAMLGGGQGTGARTVFERWGQHGPHPGLAPRPLASLRQPHRAGLRDDHRGL